MATGPGGSASGALGRELFGISCNKLAVALANLEKADDAVSNRGIDYISMARPFIREPGLPKRWEQGDTSAAKCISCNKCFAAMFNDIPINCYTNGIPSKYFAK